MTKRTWIWIVVAIIAALTVGCFAVIGTGIYVVSRRMQTSTVDAASADRQFEEVRDRFKGTAPLISIGPDGEASLEALERRGRDYSGPLPRDLHILAFNERDGKIVRLSLPFWMLRLGRGGDGGKLRVDTIDLDRYHIRAEDLERAGPALILDQVDRGKRVMLWTE